MAEDDIATKRKRVAWNKGLKSTNIVWNKGKKFPERSGINSNLWGGGEIQKTCKICNAIFFVRKYRKDTAIYCSRNCQHNDKDAYLKRGEKNSGEKSYWFGKQPLSWRGGKLKYVIKMAKIRDKYTCQSCGLHEPEIMVVDHTIPRYIRPDLTLDMNNLKTLCPNCHARKTKIDTKNIMLFKKEQNKLKLINKNSETND